MHQERIRLRNGPCLFTETITVHEYQPDKKTAMAMRVMEKHFMKSHEGQPFVQDYNRLEAEMANLRKRYNDLWEKAEPAFVDYMKMMGGMDA